MALKLAETTADVRSHTSLDYLGATCPEADYLDAFNSGCWTSSQLTSDGCTHAWSKDVLSCKLPMITTISHNTSACSDASSVECIDVALESQKEVNRSAKTVPKRQIQLKRRVTAEHPATENSNTPLHVSWPSRPRDLLQRQHSTPAALHQDRHGSEPQSVQAERKQRLQKSLSLDETSSKTKMASCIIKSVLSKRMQHEQNLQDVSDRVFTPSLAYSTANKDYMTSAKEMCNEATKVAPATGPLSVCFTSSSSPTLRPESQTKSSSIKEHVSVNSKTQAKLTAKHSFNPLFSSIGRTEFLGSSTEITSVSESEKEKLSPCREAVWMSSQSSEEKLSCDSAKEKLSPSKEAVLLSSWSSGEKPSCDSAKGKAWNPSVAKQTTVKTTPEECYTAQGAHKQQSVKNQSMSSLEEQEKQNEVKESTLSPTMAACPPHGLDASTSDNVLSQSAQCGAVKEQQSDRGELRTPGLSVNMGVQSQGKFKAIAPVHVVRDMRSLVKNKYSLSFRGPVEAGQGLEDKVPGFSSKEPHQINSQGGEKGKGNKQDDKLQKVTSPLVLDRIRDLAPLLTTPRGCATKATSFMESHDNIPSAGFTKVSPISTVKPNSCALSNSPEAQDSQTAISQADVQGSNTNVKQTNWTCMPLWASKEISTEISKNGQFADSSKTGYENHRGPTEPQRQQLAATGQYCPPTASSDQQDHQCKSSEQICPANKDGGQSPGPPPRSQNSVGLPSACVLTMAPTPVIPPYFYKPNSLGYQTISPHMGTVSYVQGPLLLQTPYHNQPTNGPVPLMRQLSEEGRLLSLPCKTDGYTVQQGCSNQSENAETRPTMPSPDTQQCAAFTASLSAEVVRGNASMLSPEVGGGLAQSTRQLLLDPETGHCFYVDMPQLPQRKMLFDPETCQYVEVLLPQQTLTGTAGPHPCVIPITPLHIPAFYTPPCLPFVQAHHAVIQPQGP